LHIDTTVTGTDSVERIILEVNDDDNDYNLLAGAGSGIRFDIPVQSDSQIGASIDAVRESGTDANSSTGLAFSTSQNDEVLDEAMRISMDGEVGIGKTNPTSTFEVYKDGDFTTPLVRFTHGEESLDGTDTILDLDFDDDQSIGASNYYITFQNQDGVVGSVNSEVAFSTFTGAHVSQRPSGSDFSNWKPGMIVKSTGDIIPFSGSMSSSISMAWPIVDIVTTQKDKAVMGVYDVLISAPIDHENYTTSSRDVGRMSGLNDNAPSIHYNAVGEGKLLVTDTNGNIETGDYICSSARIGHGEKQDDGLLHNYTVAKATEPYNFTSASNDPDLGYKSVLIACTYHCG